MYLRFEGPLFTLGITGLTLAMVACAGSATSNNQNSDRIGSTSGSISSLRAVDISNFKGDSFYNFILGNRGLKSNYLDVETQRPLNLSNTAILQKASSNFDPRVYQKVVSQFAQRELGFNELLNELSIEKNLTPKSLPTKISKILDSKSLASDPKKIRNESQIIAPYIGLASGAGVSVVINRDNYYYNYSIPTQKEGNQRTSSKSIGSLSFAASPGHKALDVTEPFYFSELDNYLREDHGIKEFYHALLATLIHCDTSEYVALSPSGQTVLTDFIATYTAAFFSDLKSKNAGKQKASLLAEKTLLKALARHQEINFEKDKAVKVRGPASAQKKRSLYGQEFQKLVAKNIKKSHPELISKIEDLLDIKPNANILHEIFNYLNSSTNQEKIRVNAKALTESLTNYLGLLRSEGQKIAQSELDFSNSKID